MLEQGRAAAEHRSFSRGLPNRCLPLQHSQLRKMHPENHSSMLNVWGPRVELRERLRVLPLGRGDEAVQQLHLGGQALPHRGQDVLVDLQQPICKGRRNATPSHRRA